MLSDAIDLNQIKRVLVTKLRHHGDVLLTSPVFQVLKNHAPHLEIDALVYAETAPMLTLHPAIHTVFCIDRNWRSEGFWARLRHEWALFKAMKVRGYDLIVHLTDHPRGPWLKQFLGARYGIAPEMSEKSRFGWNRFTHLYPIANRRHTVERHLDALRRIGISPSTEERRLFIEPGTVAKESVRALLQNHGLLSKGFVQYHPGSRWMFKTWPSEKVATLLNQLKRDGLAVVLTAAPEDRELKAISQIMSLTNGNIVNFAGKLTLKELAALSAQAALFVGVDSAPMHIAAAVGTPIVAMFGPSSEVKWGPWMVEHRVVTSSHSCRPCGIDGCGGGKISECLTTLPVEHVYEAIRDITKRA
jgi:heptosyltransferase III